ncbi:hypothetical protein, partial [Bacillus pumilus]|uniref:hypothetical protein n=1 Tax=Bacillus pumilus TaxID=1408 RepID=UPI001642CAC7
QSDAIIKYQQAINDIEIGRVIDDLGEFNKTIDDNTAKIKNNVDNLKEGLVSGTKLKDLQSSKASIGDFKRDNQYEKLAKQRIALEKDVQQALDGFAKKNVERIKGVSKATLTITASTYNQMLKMASNYTAKKKNSAKAIKTQYKDLVSIGNIDEDYKLVVKLDKALDALSDKQTALAKKYDADIAKAKTSSAKDTITNKYILDSLKLQEQYYKATIDGNKMAISELNKKLKDPSLTDEQ